jgi:hypothetical protein
MQLWRLDFSAEFAGLSDPRLSMHPAERSIIATNEMADFESIR